MNLEAEKLSLLRILAARPQAAFTQRDVARALRVSKVEARRRLRTAVVEGSVEASLGETPSAPGRQLFSLAQPKGQEELERLERRSSPSAPRGEPAW